MKSKFLLLLNFIVYNKYSDRSMEVILISFFGIYDRPTDQATDQQTDMIGHREDNIQYGIY